MDIDALMGKTPGFLEQPTRYLFFTGKGGVGKTSLSTATALELLMPGKRCFWSVPMPHRTSMRY